MDTTNRLLFDKIPASGRRIAALFSPASRAIITVTVLLYCIGTNYLLTALETPHLIDERTWVDRSLAPLWDADMPRNQYYALHHPSFARLVYRTILHARGVYSVDRPLVDYSQSAEWNFERGAFVPLYIETPLRAANIVFLTGMVAFVYLGLKRILANRALALAGCLPVIYNYPIRDGTAAYLGTDAMLLFWLAAFWYVWLTLGSKGFRGVLVMAVTGGLMVSTKVNGAFALGGAGLYYLFTQRGARRVLYPLTLAAVPVAVFVALNPIYRAGDVAWAVSMFKEVLRIMVNLKAKSTANAWATFGKTEILKESLPFWFFYLPIAAVIAGARRHKYFAVTAFWAAPVVILNWALIYIPLLRYCAPINLGFLVIFAAAGIPLITQAWESLSRSPTSDAAEAAA